MRFQEVLAILSKCHNRGLAYFDSEYVASLLNCSVEKASKWLSRLHRMGFLKRKRLKRECLSKHGKLCYKGYKYEYSLSNQGLKYIRWMIQEKPILEALCLKMVSETVSKLPERSKEAILSYINRMENSKYKGSNRFLQTLGVMVFALPALTESLAETISEKKKLEEKCEHLNIELENLKKALIKAIEHIYKLSYENNRFNQILYKLGSICVKGVKITEAYNEVIKALSIENDVQRKIISDLALPLMANQPEATPKFLQLLRSYYASDQMLFKESLNKAKQIIEEAKH